MLSTSPLARVAAIRVANLAAAAAVRRGNQAHPVADHRPQIAIRGSQTLQHQNHVQPSMPWWKQEIQHGKSYTWESNAATTTSMVQWITDFATRTGRTRT